MDLVLTLVNDCELTVLSPISGYKYVFKRDVPVEIKNEDDMIYLLDQFKGKMVKGINKDNQIISSNATKIYHLDKKDNNVSETSNLIEVLGDGTVKMGNKIIKSANENNSVSEKIIKKRRKKSIRNL